MLEPRNGGENGHSSDTVVGLLTKLTELEEKQVAAAIEQSSLAKQRTDTTSNLALYASKTSDNAEKQTGMAQERTSLTREQTRLSTRSAELANLRTELAQERTFQAEERTRLATQRTDMARQRTSLSERRTTLADLRNRLAEDRTAFAVARTRLSLQRTELARGRTSLALIRTGLAFLTAGITLFRYFGVSMWTLFDLGLVAFSTLMVYFGLIGYRRAKAVEEKLGVLLTADGGTLASVLGGAPMHPEPRTQ
jgi:uncharacterized membrane protein YidH (DUF202 family)